MNSKDISNIVKDLIDEAVREYAKEVNNYLDAEWHYNNEPTAYNSKLTYVKGYGDFYMASKRIVDKTLEEFTK